MSKTLRRLLSLLGPGVPADAELLFEDEHYRYEVYRSVLDARVLEPADLLRVVLDDPDAVMAQSAATDIFESVEKSTATSSEFTEWARSLQVDLNEFPWLQRRLREHGMMAVLKERQSVPDEALLSASDWAQRRVADTTVDRRVLELLASKGRTRRVRNQAAAHLRSERPKND